MIYKNETIEIQKELAGGSGLRKYQDLITGMNGLGYLLKYELITSLFGRTPGALGLVLRAKFYPKLLGRCGRGVTFGIGVVLRHPRKIFIGDGTAIDDGCVLDAKGQDNRGIFIGRGVFLGRNTVLNCKNGDILLGDRANFGPNIMIFSASEVKVGEAALIAAFTYLVGGTHEFADPAVPVLDQGRSSQGISVGPGGWIGAHVTVFDGAVIGRHAVIGAGSIVNTAVPDYAVAAGSPVKILRERTVQSPPREHKPITVAVINFNGEKVLKETIDSIKAQDYPVLAEIVLADNGSTDGSVDLVRRNYPNVRILSTGSNFGPNPARNLALHEINAERVLMIDNDVTLAPDALSILSEAMDSNPSAGMVSCQIRHKENPRRVQYNGCDIHFAVGAVANPVDSEKPVTVGSVSAGAILIDKAKALEIGLFDEDFVFGWEDGDFAYRMSGAGYPCLVASRARAYHPQENKGIRWVVFQVRNRWWFALKNFRPRTLILGLPAIAFHQFSAGCFFILKGQGLAYLKGSFQVLGSLPSIWRKRKAAQSLRRVPDRNILTGRDMDMLGDVGGSLPVRLATAVMNAIFRLNWFFIRRLID